MIRIVTSKEPARNIKGVGKTSGRPFDIDFQTAYAHLMDQNGELSEFPERFEFMLSEGQILIPRTHYTLHPSSLIVKAGNLVVGSVRLVPIQPATK